ncbi:MAG: DUF4147 domain-containing protein [Rhodothermales bacterium]
MNCRHVTQAQLVTDAQAIFSAAVDRVRPTRLFEALDWQVQLAKPLDQYRHVLVLAAGKASAAMVKALHTKIGDRITEGVAVVPNAYLPDAARVSQVKLIGGGHPMPHAGSVQAAEQALALAASATADDLVIVLLSGGGSALWTAPAEGLTLADLQQTNHALLHGNAPIQSINTVRKHLSRIKGGRLAQVAQPAEVLALVLSDVIGDDLSTIASGPTVPDPTTFAEALAIIDRLPTRTSVPTAAWHHLKRGVAGTWPETLKQAPVRSQTVLIGSNRMALEAARQHAEGLGYATRIVREGLDGEARVVGLELARYLAASSGDQPTCYLWGGETTVHVQGTGQGGRNQELALAAARALEGEAQPCVLLSGGTDGIDGPTPAAGAWATPATGTEANRLGLMASEYLDNNDAYTFFEQVGGLLQRGPTHTNVMDVQIGLVCYAQDDYIG